jgi:hypothetical protein
VLLIYVQLRREADVSFGFAPPSALRYRGPAQGDIAAVGQPQLLQPFFALAATLLDEPVTSCWL